MARGHAEDACATVPYVLRLTPDAKCVTIAKKKV